jgi:recombination protein RecA
MGNRDDLDRLLASASNRVAGATVLRLDDFVAQRGAIASDDHRFELPQLAGRVTEVSGYGATAVLSCAVGVVLDAQTRGEPVVWIAVGGSTFYPPDLDESGVDLDALVVVKVRELVVGARAAERLLRSGAFGLVVIDAADPGERDKAASDAQVPMGHLGRLHALAQQHDAAVVVLTNKPRTSTSLGSIVSLRVDAIREGGISGKPYGYKVDAVKDKRRGPWSLPSALLRPPAGLK